jgi:hypothetical protein
MSHLNQDKLIRRLRERFDLSEEQCSDAELLRATKGTFNRLMVEISIISGDIKRAIRQLF